MNELVELQAKCIALEARLNGIDMQLSLLKPAELLEFKAVTRESLQVFDKDITINEQKLEALLAKMEAARIEREASIKASKVECDKQALSLQADIKKLSDDMTTMKVKIAMWSAILSTGGSVVINYLIGKF